MDLSIDIEDYKLNIRAGGLIIHNNKILAHKNVNKDHYCIPGGRIELGENSENTIKREIQEELGKDIDILEFSSTIENFFYMNEKKYHELYFLYKVEFKNEDDKKIDYTMHNKEGKDYLQYEWLDIDKIDEYNILPECLKDMLKKDNMPIHVINGKIQRLF